MGNESSRLLNRKTFNNDNKANNNTTGGFLKSVKQQSSQQASTIDTTTPDTLKIIGTSDITGNNISNHGEDVVSNPPPPSESTTILNIDSCIQRLLSQRRSKVSRSINIKQSEILAICLAARETFMDQPMFLELNPPVIVCGDIHGQFNDLLRIFDMCGYPPSANYLFLGDYVDRGKQSLETILLLFCYKIKFRDNFFILRGNHECASVNRVYGFYDECKRRASLKVWRAFADTFNTLPIAALVAGKIFCVHGGLSPSLESMQDIKTILRPVDVPDAGLMNDLLWSDPTDNVDEWEDSERGVSYCFGRSIVDGFLQKFNMDLIVRAHMVVEEGYEFFNNRTLVTVFSAPNYCNEFDNKGAVMTVNEDLLCSFEILLPQYGYQKYRNLNNAAATSRLTSSNNSDSNIDSGEEESS